MCGLFSQTGIHGSFLTKLVLTKSLKLQLLICVQNCWGACGRSILLLVLLVYSQPLHSLAVLSALD